MVLDTFTPDMVDLSYIMHPLVMATTTTTTTTTTSSSSASDGFMSKIEELFCGNETFAAYCTITRNADGTTTKSISTEDWAELAGIGIVVGALIATYLLIGIVGMFVFPPMIICLAM